MKKVVYAITLVLFSTIETRSQVTLIKETYLTNTSFDDRYGSYSPDGNKILFESNRDGNWEIYIMEANGEHQKRLTVSKSNNKRPSWHPNGKKVLFESDRSGKNELYEMKLNTLEIKQITSFEHEETLFGSYSPNGKLIAISLKESEDKSNILLLKSNGNVSRAITKNKRRNYYPKWSSNGKEIVYFSRKDTNNEDDEIYKVNIETGDEFRLTNWPRHNFCPSWSNDNKRIVYVTSMEGIRPEIYVMDSDGKNQLRITDNEDGDTLPFWSPTDDKLLITGYRNGSFKICEIALKIAP